MVQWALLLLHIYEVVKISFSSLTYLFETFDAFPPLGGEIVLTIYLFLHVVDLKPDLPVYLFHFYT